jgi:hypothetical protein
MKLKIGAIEYDVREVEDLHTTDEQGHKVAMHGAIYYDDTQISIERHQNAQQKIATLWHEAVHGILNQAGHTEHEEAHVIALGYGLAALVRDNPDLVALTLGEAVIGDEQASP